MAREINETIIYTHVEYNPGYLLISFYTLSCSVSVPKASTGIWTSPILRFIIRTKLYSCGFRWNTGILPYIKYSTIFNNGWKYFFLSSILFSWCLYRFKVAWIYCILESIIWFYMSYQRKGKKFNRFIWSIIGDWKHKRSTTFLCKEAWAFLLNLNFR